MAGRPLILRLAVATFEAVMSIGVNGIAKSEYSQGEQGNRMTYPIPTQPKASHFIDGQYIEDSAGAVIEVTYPYTREVIATVHEATDAIIEQAMASAVAHNKPGQSYPVLSAARCYAKPAS